MFFDHRKPVYKLLVVYTNVSKIIFHCKKRVGNQYLFTNMRRKSFCGCSFASKIIVFAILCRTSLCFANVPRKSLLFCNCASKITIWLQVCVENHYCFVILRRRSSFWCHVASKNINYSLAMLCRKCSVLLFCVENHCWLCCIENTCFLFAILCRCSLSFGYFALKIIIVLLFCVENHCFKAGQ